MILVPQRSMIALLNLLGDRVEVSAPLLQNATLFTIEPLLKRQRASRVLFAPLRIMSDTRKSRNRCR
jgi:hypothetical protein